MVIYGGLAGLLPFLASALAWYFGWLSLQPFISYSIIILSFLSGVVWWHGLAGSAARDRDSETPHVTALPTALVLPVGAWLVLFLPDVWTVLLLAIGYLALWVWEMMFLRRLYRRHYVVLRAFLTLVVVLVHLGIWATLRAS